MWMPHSVLPCSAQRPERGRSGDGRLRARLAADRRVALLQQRVDGHLVIGDVALYVEVRPGGQRIDLHEAPQVAEPRIGRRLAASSRSSLIHAALPANAWSSWPTLTAEQQLSG